MAQQDCGGPVMMIDWVRTILLRRSGAGCCAGCSATFGRLSTVLAADQILVMNHRRTVERATRGELVEQDRLCATLYERRFRATADPDDLTAIGVEPRR
jgi:hypothetical protein